MTSSKQVGNPTGKGGFKDNPQNRHSGHWKKESTPRFKLEQMMKLSDFDLQDIQQDLTAPTFERKLATFILDGDWKTIREMCEQVYGQPKQTVDATYTGNPVVLAPVRPDDVSNDSIPENT
jgi:hypothetical protein